MIHNVLITQIKGQGLYCQLEWWMKFRSWKSRTNQRVRRKGCIQCCRRQLKFTNVARLVRDNSQRITWKQFFCLLFTLLKRVERRQIVWSSWRSWMKMTPIKNIEQSLANAMVAGSTASQPTAPSTATSNTSHNENASWLYHCCIEAIKKIQSEVTELQIALIV